MLETKRSYWRRLDNAAKLFSATSNKRDTRVFRFYCELEESVDQGMLQLALNKTLKQYPVFLSVMRRGLFWHYLEKSSLRPVVKEEYREPCSTIYVRDKRQLLFEVTYYRNRIILEVYHALTDGTGAMEFLRELVKNYLLEAHMEEGLCDVSLADKRLTVEDQEMDSFAKYYTPGTKKKKEKKPRAFQIRKPRKERGALQVTESTLSVKELLNKAREKNVSITVYLAAVLMCAIHEEMTRMQEKRPIILMVPVNLRKFFPSYSMLNFFGWIEPGYRFGEGEDTLDQVLAWNKEIFSRELTKERIAERMDSLISLEVHPLLKWVPLSLKNLCINAGAKISERDVTAILSNMSAVNMPEEYIPYISRFGVYTSTPKIELCVCSFGDKLSLGFTSRFDSTNIKRNFLRILEEQGISTRIEEPQFPDRAEETYREMKVFQWCSFLCLVSVVAMIASNFIFTPEVPWPWLAAGGMASMWVAFAVGYYKRHNLLKNAIWQLAVVTVGCIIWDVVTGWKGWSVNYLLPAACTVIQLVMLMVSRIQKYTAREYMIYFVMAAVYGCVLPLILLLTGVTQIVYPSVLCIGFSFLFLAALPIFKGREFREEMHKKFHI